MKVEFLNQFSKDIEGVHLKSVRASLIQLIELMEKVEKLSEISGTKKMKGHRSAYKTRIGNYRLGFFFENSTILLARFLHRKDIYKIFP